LLVSFLLCGLIKATFLAETCSCILRYKYICCFDGLFVGLAVIRIQLGPGKHHQKLKAVICRKNLIKIMYKRLFHPVNENCFIRALFVVHELKKSSGIISRIVGENG
jgi:hypothetical protein